MNKKLTGYARFKPMQEELKRWRTLAEYSKRYEISVQMWPKQWAVYIAKDGVDLYSLGGEPEEVLQRAIDFLNRINKVVTCQEKSKWCNNEDVKLCQMKSSSFPRKGGNVYDGKIVSLCRECRKALNGQFKVATESPS